MLTSFVRAVVNRNILYNFSMFSSGFFSVVMENSRRPFIFSRVLEPDKLDRCISKLKRNLGMLFILLNEHRLSIKNES